MKRNFFVGLFGGLIGLAMLLILFSAAGVVGARAVQSQPDAARAQDVSAATPLTSTFTYQGQLKNGGNAVNGSCQMAFRLYGDPTASTNLIGSPFTTTVPITNGLFTVGLNFGSNVFDGNNSRWLDIQVNCGSGFVTLTPRQALTPAPYAFALPGLYTQPNATSPNIIGGYSGNSVTSGIVGAVIGGGGSSGYENRVQAHYATVGGGGGNSVTATYATIGGGYYNTASGAVATVGGGSTNTASGQYATVGGGAYNVASGNGTFIGGGGTDGISSNDPNTAEPTLSTIGGGAGNHVNSGSDYGVIAGGRYNSISNNAPFASVGGGRGNTAGNLYATVGGGRNNTASGNGAFVGGGGWDGTNELGNQAVGDASTIGGGLGNSIPVTGTYTTIGGGKSNTASGNYDIVGGGSSNSASGDHATVGGGESNTASGGHATIDGGASNIANGNDSAIGGGVANTAGNWFSTVGGGDSNNASGDHATVPGGYFGSATHYGEMAYASGRFANTGDAQTSVYVLRNTTTNTTTTELFLDGSSQRITLPVSRTVTFDILIMGVDSTGSSAGWQVLGMITNVGGTTLLVNPVIKTVISNGLGWNAIVQADNPHDALVIDVIGAASTTIRWVATVRTVEVGW